MHGFGKRMLTVAGAAVLAVAWTPAVAVTAAGAQSSNTIVIGVDNTSPPGHNYEYADFFPDTNVSVAAGSVIDFKWNTGAVDGLHTATLLPSTETPDQAWQSSPLAGPDTDEPGALPDFNPAVFGPSNPPAGSGAPGACGDATTPCTFDGTGLLNSGANPNAPGADFYVKVSATPGTYNIVCLVHPGMKGTVTVGSASTPQPVLDANSATQHQADDAEAQAAADAVSAQVTPNGDGTNTVVARAGLTTQHVRVDEFLPANLTVHPGDKVTWLASASNIHTVTFPAGPAGNVIDPLTPPYSPGECETASGPDGQPTGPPPFGCGPDPSKFEQTLNPNPFGPASILPSGYRLGSADGSVAAFGSPAPLAGASHLAAPIVALVETQDDLGYWQFGADGGVFASGDAPFYGSAVGKITAPVVGGFAAPDGSSYTLVSQDGNTYTLGANTHNGSGLPKLAAPAVGGTTSPGLFGPGGWVAAADGGVFSIGAAPFLGSAGALHLNAPVVGMAATPDGGGYWLVASDGGIFNYGDAPFLGSLGGTHLNAPIVGIAATDSGQGYTLVAADGGVFTFGDAVFSGSAGGTHLSAPVTSIGFVNSTLASSGVLATAPIPYPSSYTFSFRAGGTFTYQCRIHDHMRAVVTVA